MNKCILTGVELSQKDDSKAHIIPSALGGTIKPKGILSKSANTILNEKFDVPLIKTLSVFMALLGAAPDRGKKSQPAKMKDGSGNEYYVNYGENLKPTKPKLLRRYLSKTKVQYKLEARTPKEMQSLLKKLKKDHPEINIDEIIKDVQPEDSKVQGMLHTELELGPDIFFPASFIMASIFSASKNLPVHPKFKDFVDKFDLSIFPNENVQIRIPPDTFYWIQKNDWFKVSSEVSHTIVLFGDSKRKKSLFYVEMFNLAGVAVILPYDGDSDVYHTYSVDVLNAKEEQVDFNIEEFSKLEWKSTHPWNPNNLYDFLVIARKKANKVTEIIQRRAANIEIMRQLENKLEQFDNSKIADDETKKMIINTVIQYHLERIFSTINPQKIEDDLINILENRDE